MRRLRDALLGTSPVRCSVRRRTDSLLRNTFLLVLFVCVVYDIGVLPRLFVDVSKNQEQPIQEPSNLRGHHSHQSALSFCKAITFLSSPLLPFLFLPLTKEKRNDFGDNPARRRQHE